MKTLPNINVLNKFIKNPVNVEYNFSLNIDNQHGT